MRATGGAARPRAAVVPQPAAAQRWLARMLAAAEAGDAAAPRTRGAVATPTWIARRMARRLLAGVPRGSRLRVLDAGCGAGRLLVETARAAGAGGLRLECTGIDSDAAAARAAAALAPLVRAAFGATVGGWEIRAADFLRMTIAPSFDVAIANPPYVPLRTLDAATRRRLQAAARPGDDLAALFVARMLQFLRPGGRLVVIVPAMLLAAGHAARLRRLLQSDVTLDEVHDLSTDRAFAGVGTYPAILVLRRMRPRGQPAIAVRNARDAKQASWARDDLARLPQHVLPLGLDSAGLALAARLLSGPRLGDVVQVGCGLAASGFGRAIGAGSERILQSGDIAPLRLRPPSRFDPEQAGIPAASLARLRGRKVVIPGMFRRLCAAEDRRGVLLGRVYFVRPANATQRTILLALLNARLSAVLYRGLFAGVAQSGGYTRCNAPYVGALPWPAAIAGEAELATLIESLARVPSPECWHRLDTQIEALFGLTADEVECVERLADTLPPRPGEERLEAPSGLDRRRRRLPPTAPRAMESSRSTF